MRLAGANLETLMLTQSGSVSSKRQAQAGRNPNTVGNAYTQAKAHQKAVTVVQARKTEKYAL